MANEVWRNERSGVLVGTYLGRYHSVPAFLSRPQLPLPTAKSILWLHLLPPHHSTCQMLFSYFLSTIIDCPFPSCHDCCPVKCVLICTAVTTNDRENLISSRELWKTAKGRISMPHIRARPHEDGLQDAQQEHGSPCSIFRGSIPGLDGELPRW